MRDHHCSADHYIRKHSNLGQAKFRLWEPAIFETLAQMQMSQLQPALRDEAKGKYLVLYKRDKNDKPFIAESPSQLFESSR